MKKIRKNIIKKSVSATSSAIINVEEQLHDSAELYRIITSASMDGFVAAGTDGHILEVNDAFCRMIGFSRDELLSMSIPDLDAKEKPNETIEHIQKFINIGADVFETELKHKDGRIVEVEVSATFSSHLRRLLIFLRDITEWKRSEDALRSSEERYKQLLGSVTDYIYTIKIEGDGSITTKHGPGCIAVTGYSPHEYEADQFLWHRMIYEDDRPAISEQSANIFSGEEVHAVEHRIYHKNGTIRWVRNTLVPRRDADGQLIGYDGLISDITEQKHAEEALSESEDRFRKIFEEAHIGIVMVSRSFAFEKVNPAFCRMMGYSAVELYSMTFADITHPDHLRRDMESVNKVMRGEIPFYQTEKRYIHKSGKVIWADLIVSSIRDEHGELLHFLSMINDITERKHAEEALQTAKEYAENLIQTANTMVVGLNMKGTITVFNLAAQEITGYTRAELENRDWFETIVPKNRYPEVWAEFERLSKGGMPQRFENPILTKSGEERFITWRNNLVYEQDQVVGTISFGMDITDRKHAEEALRISEEKYRDIFERAVEGIFQSNTKGKFLNVNPAFASMLGYESPNELMAGISNIRNQLFVRPEDADFFMSSFKKSGTIMGFEHELYKKDGSKVWIYVNARAEKNKSGKIIYYEGISENISKRKQDEEEKEKLHSQLRQAQKMEALGTFVGGIAHDFNNILSIIIGYATLLNMELEKNNPLHSYTDLILSSSEKAANLTQGLLAFSRKQPIDLKRLKLNDVIKGTEKILKRLLTEDIILKKNFTKESTDIMGDASQIDQILFNLATNARDAMPKGGKLIIETKITEMDKDFMDVTGYGKTGKFVMLSVSDTGTGIENKNKEHIFDPFFTTKEVGKGTGLGLSTVYGIVKQHNGYINVYSELNIGTSFHIYFPCVNGKGKVKKKTVPKIRHGKEKVLVAEDNEGVRLLIKRILTKYGYMIIEAVDGEDAIEKFRRNKGVELMIIDSVMPKKNGREVYNEIIKINPGIKVLFTSGYTRDVVLDKGIEEKEFDFISKPVTPKKLLYKLREILDRK